MGRNRDYRADDIRRGETPDKNKGKKPNRTDEDMDVNRERNRRQERGTEHDKEDIENQ